MKHLILREDDVLRVGAIDQHGSARDRSILTILQKSRPLVAHKFPADHVVAALQDYPHPGWSQVKRSSASRSIWLSQKIARRTAMGEANGLLLDELASLVWLVEEAERRRAVGWRRDAPPCGVPCLVTTLEDEKPLSSGPHSRSSATPAAARRVVVAVVCSGSALERVAPGKALRGSR